MAHCAGCTALIARGTLERPISDVLEGKRRHIRCAAKTTPSSSWVLWLTNRLQIGGSLVIRQSAADALKDSRDGLSCADVPSMKSDFKKADVLHIYDERAVERARGISNLSSDEAQFIARNPDRSVKQQSFIERFGALEAWEQHQLVASHQCGAGDQARVTRSSNSGQDLSGHLS